MLQRCHSCQLPLCTNEASCTWRELHLRLECAVMSEFRTKQVSCSSIYQCIMPLRCLLTKELQKEHWAAVLVRS